MAALIQVICASLRNNERSSCQIPARTLLLADRPFRAFGIMPALGCGLFLMKQAVFIDHTDVSRPSVHALVSVFSEVSGEPLALLDGAVITRLKSAAVAGVVARACTPPRPLVLAVLGAGEQASAQMRGIAAVRTLAEVRVFSRTELHLKRFAAQLTDSLGSSSRIRIASSAQAAAEGVDILITATNSRTPLLEQLSLPHHAHVNCVGAHTPEGRELSHAELRRALLIVEDVATAVREAGVVHQSALDLEQMLACSEKKLQEQLTIFSSTGHAFLDLVTVSYLLKRLELFRGDRP